MEEMLTTVEVAKILKMNRQTVSNLMKRGAIPAVKIGMRWRVRKSDLDKLMTPGEEQEDSKSTEKHDEDK
ncbi:MAG: helix-turn-helix domain-containing protein [Candidatus Eremiobacteraeota bacterium]|nr:helix-turn-helix domain-containing protein [Candidatus Eremiobacteraeota bacterium]